MADTNQIEDDALPSLARLVIVTGISGAGKTTALHALEDLDFYCADNLPMPLLPKFVALLTARREIQQAALVVDARSADFLGESERILESVRGQGFRIDVLFLDAPDDVLIRRFSQTRRRHPLADGDVRSGLTEERALLESLRRTATSVVDTGSLNVHTLRALMRECYGRASGGPVVSFLSFGFKNGVPLEADIVLDVRFLANPYFVESLSAKTGLDPDVRDFVLETEAAQRFLKRAIDLLEISMEGFSTEGKAYATIAIGCTGGRHRSVAMSEALGRHFSERSIAIKVRHRDLP